MSQEKVVNNFCSPHCFNGPCEFQVTVRDGKAVRLRAHPKMNYPPCPKGWTNIKRLYHPDRLKYPMRRVGERGEGNWERISWDQALDTVASELNQIKAKYGNEALVMYHYVGSHGFPASFRGMKATIIRLLNLWGGCIPAYDRGSLCFQAFISASNHLFGGMNWALTADRECDLIIVWATNPMETHVRGVSQSFREAKKRGAKFIFIDPWFNPSAEELADEWIPIRPGTDIALALAMMNIIITEELYDKDFVIAHTNAPFLVRSDNGELLRERDIVAGGSDKYMVWDAASDRAQTSDTPGIAPALSGSYRPGGIECQPVWQRLIDNVTEWTPQQAEAVTSIPAQTVARIAREFGQAKGTKIHVGITPGFNRASWGENAVYSIGTLNAITGNYLGSISRFYPRTSAPEVGLSQTVKTLEVENQVKKRVPVNHLAEAILNPERYDTNIHSLFVMLGNPVNQHGNSNRTIEALKKLDFIAVCDSFMSATARYADILLPTCTFLEKTALEEGAEVGRTLFCLLYHIDPQPRLFYSERAVEPPGEAKDDFEIVCELAKKMGYGQYFPWQNAEEWIEEVLNLAKEDERFPWLKPVTLEQLKREGIVDLDMPPLQPTLNLRTPSGKVELYSEPLLKKGFDPMPVYREPEEGPLTTPDLCQKYPLNLVSPHFLGRSHSSFANQPELHKRFKPDVLMNSVDAQKRGIKSGDRVLVFNDRGSIKIEATVAEKIKPGVVRIYEGGWPEHGMANTLTRDALTTYGENATFNTCLVEVRKAPASG